MLLFTLRFQRLFLCFTQFGGSFQCLNVDKFRNPAPLRSGLKDGPLSAQFWSFLLAILVYILAKSVSNFNMNVIASVYNGLQ